MQNLVEALHDELDSLKEWLENGPPELTHDAANRIKELEYILENMDNDG